MMIQQRISRCKGADVASCDKKQKANWSPKAWIWRLSSAAMVVFFLAAAYVQINDPDPYIWMPVYIVPALLSTAIIFKPDIREHIVWKSVCLVHIILVLAGSVYLTAVVLQLMLQQMRNPLVLEEGRELFGLVIVALWLALSRCVSCVNETQAVVSAMMVACCILAVLPLSVWAMCYIGTFQTLSHCVEMQSSSLFTDYHGN